MNKTNIPRDSCLDPISLTRTGIIFFWDVATHLISISTSIFSSSHNAALSRSLTGKCTMWSDCESRSASNTSTIELSLEITCKENMIYLNFKEHVCFIWVCKRPQKGRIYATSLLSKILLTFHDFRLFKYSKSFNYSKHTVLRHRIRVCCIGHILYGISISF